MSPGVHGLVLSLFSLVLPNGSINNGSRTSLVGALGNSFVHSLAFNLKFLYKKKLLSWVYTTVILLKVGTMRYLLVHLLWIVNCAGKTKLKQNKQKTNKFYQENKKWLPALNTIHQPAVIAKLPSYNYEGYVHIIGFLCWCDITTASGIPQQKKQ